MDVFGTILALLGVGFLLKGIIGGIRAGMREAQRRLDAEGLGNQVTEPARQLDEERKSYPYQSTVFGLIGVAALAILLVRSCARSDPSPATPPETPAASATRADAGTVPPPPVVPAVTDPEAQARQQADFERRTAESAERMQHAAAKSKQAQALAMAKDALAAVEQLKVEMDLWENAVVALRSSDKGRALAGQPQLVRRYRALVSLPRPERTIAENLAEEARTIERPLEVAYSTPGDIMQPSAAVLAQLSDILKRVREAQEAYQKPRLQVEALVAHAQGTGEPPSKEPLGAVIVSQEQEEALESSRVVEQEYTKAKEEGTRRVAAAKAELVRAESEKEEATLKAATKAAGEARVRELQRLAEVDEIRKKADAEKREIQKRDADLERQKAFVRSPEGRRQIETYLQPFITPGFAQPTSLVGAGADRLTKKGPVSLTRLRTAATLKDDVRGLFTLAFVANSPLNDRPHWQLDSPLLTPGNLTESTIEFVTAAQTLLREYGDAMVEEGLLAK